MAPRPPIQAVIEQAEFDEKRRMWRMALFTPEGAPIDLTPSVDATVLVADHAADTTDVHGIPDTSLLVVKDSSDRVALGAASAAVDGVASRLLLKTGDANQNALTVKRNLSSWGISQEYGTGQVFELLKAEALSTDLGYTAPAVGDGVLRPDDDLILLRVTPDGSIGLGGNIHLATGLRQPSDFASGYALFIQPAVDTQHIAMQGVAGQTQAYIRVIDSAGAVRFRLLPNANLEIGKRTADGHGLLAGDLGSSGSDYFGISHSSNGTSTAYALSQGGAGDTLINAKTGQTVTLRVNNAAMVTVSSTVVTMAGELKHTGSKVGFYNAATVAKQAIAGSRGGNAALADLLTKLATMGLITDSSTA